MPKTQTALRIEPEIVAEADELAEGLAKLTPGFETTRASVLRAAIIRGLADMRRELNEKTQTPRKQRGRLSAERKR